LTRTLLCRYDRNYHRGGDAHMLIIPVLIGWLASLAGVIAITPFTAGWIGCAIVCGLLGVSFWGGLALAASFDEFTWYLAIPGYVLGVASVLLFIVAIVVPFWRGLGIHEVIVR
jgi:hypothetical protein